MKRVAICAVVVLALGGLERNCCCAEQRPGVVYLNQSRNWLLMATGAATGRPLARELVRQAFLISARDELRLTTRDAWLGDPMPSEGDNAPWDVVAAMREPVTVEIVRGFSPNQTSYAQHELHEPVRTSDDVDYCKLTELEEKLSRVEFAAALKKAGFDGQPNARQEKAAVPESIETLLGEMNFVSQYRAVRELHALMRSQGESPALLGALAQGYANLGVMTEYYWHPAHKVFKARALLYAQRMLARDEKSPLARWHRAYAAAMAGFYVWAEADLDEADKAWQAMPAGDHPPRPAWVELIGPLCHYQVEALGRHVNDAKIGNLAALLKYLAVEQAGGQTWAVQTAIETVRAIPECYLVHDRLCEFGGVSVLHRATMEPIKLAGKRFYGRVSAMHGLPADARRVVDGQATGLGDWLGGLLGGEDSDATAEFPVRKQLVDALLKTGELAAPKGKKADKAPDVNEPSWAALGVLIRELSFMQVYRRARFERYELDVSTEPWLTSSAPLVEGHPYRVFLDTYAWERDKQKEAAARLAKVDVAGLNFQSWDMNYGLGDNPRSKQLTNECWKNEDFTVRDLVTMIRICKGNKAQLTWAGKILLQVSPHSPLARTVLVANGWEGAADKIEEWDMASASYPQLSSAIGAYYMNLGRWDDAERCYKAAIKIVPGEMSDYMQLAEIYKQRGQTDRWLATLEAYLKQPDYALNHYSVQSDIAHHFMDHKQWEEALPHAEGAAECGSGWGYLCAAKCYEGLQRWEEAERCYRACSERYRDGTFQWYYFCRRTGQGDLDAARQVVETLVKDPANLPTDVNRFDLIAFYLLEDKAAKAMPEFERAWAKNANAYDALWKAVTADQLDDAKERDVAINRARALSPQSSDATESPSGVRGLTDLIVEDLAHGGKGKIDLDVADRLGTRENDSDRFSINYLLAKYLDLHGQHEAADRYWKRCMGCVPQMSTRYRTLAGESLCAHHIQPEDYKSLLEPDAVKVKKATPSEQPASKPEAKSKSREKKN